MHYALYKGAGTDDHAGKVGANKQECLTWDPGGIAAPAKFSGSWKKKISVNGSGRFPLPRDFHGNFLVAENVDREAPLEAANVNYDVPGDRVGRRV